MKLKINGKEFEYFVFDTPATIIDRYISTLGKEEVNDLHPIPQFYRFEQDVITLANDMELTLLDVRKILHKTSYDGLANVYDTEIKDKYNLTPNQVAVIWILTHKGKIPTVLDNLMLLNRYDLNTEINVKSVIEREQKWNKVEYEKLESRIKLLKQFKDVFKGEIIPSTPFEIDEIIAELQVLPENRDSLLDLFDEFIPSKTVPFISLNFRGKKYYKVYKYLVPPLHWRLENDMVNGLFFKILRVDNDYFDLNNNTDLSKIDSYYTSVTWNEDNKIRFGFKIKGKIGQQELTDSILSSITAKINVVSTTQHSIKGSFKIPNRLLNKTVLLDMITNDRIFSFFFYVDEIAKSASKKDALYIKYLPKSSTDTDEAITLIFTNMEEKKNEPFLNIRISKAKTIDQANQFQNLFGYLLSYYFNQESDVAKIYSALIPSFKLTEKKIKKERKEKKTGQRADALRIFNEALFPKHYARAVAKKEQPYVVASGKGIIPSNQVGAYIKKYGANKIMEYPVGSGNFYACEPREKGESQRYIYPGLRENTSSDMPNRDTEHWLPACFTGDQKKKAGSGYNKYIRRLQGEEEEVEKKKDNILGPEKPIGADRLGALPLQIANIFNSININPDKSILRYGVLGSPASLLYCLERVFNKDYDIISPEGRQKRIKEIRKELSKVNFAISKQQTFSMTDAQIKAILLNENAYVDPSYFIKLCEELYSCNIILFVRDSTNPQGNLSLINYSQVLLNTALKNRPTIFVIKNEVNENLYPYQCELIYYRSKKVDDISERFIFGENGGDKKILEEIERMYYDANDVFHLTKSLAFVVPFVENNLTKGGSEGPIAQYIDSIGKCRMLKYKVNGFELCFMIAPIPPLDLPIFSKIQNASIKDAQKFIKKYEMNITSQIVNGETLKGIFVESDTLKGYIPIEKARVIPKIPIEDNNVYPPLMNQKTSLLQQMRDNRKIAHILEQYTLYLYSQNPESFSEKNFKVIKDHNYDLNLITKTFDLTNKTLIKSNKIIVNTPRTIDKLLFFITQFKQNNPVLIKSYKDRKLVDGYYSTISDFKENTNSIIFLNLSSMNKWANRGGQYINEILISNILREETDEPYLYRTNTIEKGRLMLLQNVYNARLERALSVSLGWLRGKINSGYATGLVDISEYGYKIYNTQGLVSSHKGKKVNNQYLSVFEYGDEDYSAILFL